MGSNKKRNHRISYPSQRREQNDQWIKWNNEKRRAQSDENKMAIQHKMIEPNQLGLVEHTDWISADA